MTINDVHCHFFSTPFFDALAPADPAGPNADAAAGVTNRLGWEAPGTAEALADRWAAELDRHSVARAALIASVPGDEASVAAAFARHPGRFVPFAMFDPTRPDAPDRARRALQMGVRGLCLFPAMHRFRVDEERALGVFEAAAAVPGTAVFVHCGVLSVGVRTRLGLPNRFDVRLGDPLAVHVAAAAFPQVPVIIPHFGAGFLREALAAADLSPNIHLDTSSSNGWIKYHPGLTLADVFRRALDVVGPDRLIFGTDSSYFPRGWQRGVFEAQKAALESIGADEAACQRVFGGTFDRLFGGIRDAGAPLTSARAAS
jgi:predicted TIM-barrel fold metal-dependent hydrolase